MGYFRVNLAFLLSLLLVVAYSFLFSNNNHPIPAALTEITGIIPPSKGLSSAFSQIVRLNISKALFFNPISLRVFSFFLIQIVLRAILTIVIIKITESLLKKLLLADIVVSAGVFVYTFFPLIKYTIEIFILPQFVH